MTEKVELLRLTGGDRLALVGLGVDFPGCQNLESFFRSIIKGSPVTGAAPGWQTTGCLSRAANSALAKLAGQIRDVGLLGIGPAAEVSRLRNQVEFDGPVLDYAGYREALPSMLIQAHEWLENHEAQAVLLAGCSLAAEAPQSNVTLGFDRSVNACPAGSGAVAVTVMRLKEAQRRGYPVFAVLETLASTAATHRPVTSETVQSCAQSALQVAGLEAQEIGYLEALACGEDAVDLAEIQGLVRIYNGDRSQTALGSGQPITGFLEGINGLAALVRTALCITNRLRPGASGWSEPKVLDLWQDSSLYVPVESLTWFHPENPGRRAAAIDLIGKDGGCGHLILTESEPRTFTDPILRSIDLLLFPLGGSSVPELIDQLETLKAGIQSGTSLLELARNNYLKTQSAQVAQVACILGHSPAEVQREVEFAIRGLPGAAEKGSEWQTPQGSYYTPRPLGQDNKVAFVYPGAFNSYVGAGKDLFILFPRAYDLFSSLAEDVGATLREDRLYPRSLVPWTKEQVDRLEADLLADPFAMMMSGTSLSVALTTILRDTFQVHPNCGFGYSLGENSLLFAMGVWGDGLHASRKLYDSDLFHTRLAGPQNAVREYWGLPDLKDGEDLGQLWANYLLMAPVDRVREALVNEPHVYLTHINTPRQVVIGGDPTGCRRIIDRLKCSSLKAPFDYVLHCKAMESEYQSLYKIHTLPVRQVPPVKLYSAADDQPFTLTEPELARAVSRDLCSMLDFPRLVETAYADGARIFIELGAGSNCAKWIEEILRGKPFLSVSANRKGVDDATSILRVLARLASHQAAVDLDPLYQG